MTIQVSLLNLKEPGEKSEKKLSQLTNVNVLSLFLVFLCNSIFLATFKLSNPRLFKTIL